MANRIQVARALAERFGVRYNRRAGPDIRTEELTINVETARTMDTAVGRLRGYRGPVYIACANDRDIPLAREYAEGKTVGVMNSTGEILKPSTRNRWP